LAASRPIRLAIAGIGNCASALVQGIHHYRAHPGDHPEGVMEPLIAGCRPGDIEVVAAFDIDRRKVGRPLAQAIFAAPNCTRIFHERFDQPGPAVLMAPVLDGVAPHMAAYPDDQAFRPAELPPVDLAAELAAARAEVLVCYLPVGSEQAVRHVAEACLAAKVALVNCVPVFIASNPDWSGRFRAAGLPLIGDDIKSQLGATILHRALARLFTLRGCTLDRTYQLNTGGNTDFLNMLAEDRLASKRRSKTGSVQSQLAAPLPEDDIHIGPSDYVPWQKDNKVAFMRLEGRGFGGAPLEIEVRLSVQDSPNSAGIVIDAIRCARLARERGLAGALEVPSAVYMKTPPRQMDDSAAHRSLQDFLA
jgi:myo-inositol-1-phosphate synthase